ncbi:hypothetical protein B0H15DRAFT_459503 [Mycena belliarum]|uniref:F-box domain-containing protein n=1 Tax=Mycena belliarum TaxID=1033014 RepID=A0AAD6UHK0_9AGAR|nr:hypothetical protein B0H15DRAFT_459503 [Mycena belliae]
MPGIELLSPDLLTDIMLRASESIDEKFTVSQVSQLWRNTALDTPLLWTSLKGYTTLDCHRVPLMLGRTGSTAMLHIDFIFGLATSSDRRALGALVPYVARIESLYLNVERSGSVELASLLDSHLEFPALNTLRLYGSHATPLSLSAPQLQSLEIDYFDMKSWDTVLVPSLEKISIWDVMGAGTELFSDILMRCPRAWSITFISNPTRDYNPDRDLHELFARRHLAPTLRELNLHLRELESVLKIGFCDTDLESLTGWVYNGEHESDFALLLDVMFPGVGPLVICDYLDSDSQQIKFHDDSGRIRRLKCYNEDSDIGLDAVWTYLSIHHDLHKTVRELRIPTWPNWSEYLDAFELYPPAQESITLIIDVSLGGWGEPDYDEPDWWTSRKLRISGLRKIEVIGSWTLVLISEVLGRIELPGSRKIEVCVSGETPEGVDSLSLGLSALQRALTELAENWVLCAHCIATA